MGWQRFLGIPTPAGGDAAADGRGRAIDEAADTETVRRIVGRLEAMPRDEARFLAGFAYILTRAAAADLEISEAEEQVIERLVAEHGHLPESHAVLVSQMARSQSLLYGGTEDYLVTRQFKDLSTAEQRLDLLRCCYLVGAADDDISIAESDTLQQIAAELDVDRPAVNAIRHEFEPKLSTIKAMLRLRDGG
ncbi:MAG TPA: TerB family tellurite resistance protein [Candidatus Limnocylindrales bacterium]|nr:TerB family tellurite resistance protein [Candidatus Limnocylindrales bacterium]